MIVLVYCILLLFYCMIFVFSLGPNINIIFYIAQTPTVRPRAHCIVIISCYSEQYVRFVAMWYISYFYGMI